MSRKEEFICKECGKIHSKLPALGFSSPDNYHNLSQEEKDSIAKLDSDFCVIKHEDQTDRFIRVILVQKLIDSDEVLEYGLWVSLSEKSFMDYVENYNNEAHETSYFGWLCNSILPYKNTMSIPVDVLSQKGNQRPIIFPKKEHEHQFVVDFLNGISSHEAQERVDNMMKNSG